MHRIRRFIFSLIVLLAVIPPTVLFAAPLHGAGLPRADLIVWHQEGDAAMQRWGIQKIFDAWAIANAPGSTLTLVQKYGDDLATGLLTPAAGTPAPDLLWTTTEHLDEFAHKGLVQPVDPDVDLSLFTPVIAQGARVGDRPYGIPLGVNNMLVMYYNKRFVKTAPNTFDELRTMGEAPHASTPDLDTFAPLVYDELDSFWVFPIAHGFGGTEFGPDKKTPALNTDAWSKTFQLLYALKYDSKIDPGYCDYECADERFKAGTAAITFNGDWALDTYVQALGNDLGIAAWPSVGVVPAQNVPQPFVVGKYLMLSAALSGDRLETAAAFARFLASDEGTLLSWMVPNRRLPVLLSALKSDRIQQDPVLSQTSKILNTSVEFPVQPEMPCVVDGLNQVVRSLMGGNIKPVDAAPTAQAAAVHCISQLNSLSK